MPPAAVKTIEDLLYWEYAKIIAVSAGRVDYAFIMDRFKKLQTGQIKWSPPIREYIKEREDTERCVYCGRRDRLTLEHILPRIRGGPDDPSNAVWVCRKCNSSKGDRRLYEWFGIENRNSIPRIAQGKYLKLLYEMHSKMRTLRVEDVTTICPQCDFNQFCPEKGVLTVYCLEGLFTKRSRV